jgi:hypothetical protein
MQSQLHVRGTGFLVIRCRLRSSITWVLQVWQPLAEVFLIGSITGNSPSMHGTLLDQRVFESLVTRCLPMIHNHFQEVDVQLSVASLPWFLSLLVCLRLVGQC